ncbi:GDSL-type esterase/lipase family protein [Arthrobacter sedimenti]|uniref:GDSL-type esterase/lipase family protein n=1 Tax=Arthrobacter sedimenti TaxID=2694931 RepID=UPI001CDD80E7|nr:GDSL-type esterase/lipase family protein [Arthrobacter sedimenti]
MIADASSKLSGVRLEFETDATWIELELTFTRVSLDWVGLPTRPAVVSLTMADGTEQELSFDEGHILQLEPDFTTKLVPGSRTFARFELPAADEPRSLELWFPPNCSVELHHVRADRDLRPSVPSNPRWIHYGSSISQASEADTPLGVWPVIAARRLELDLLNLGLGGSAHLDQFAARTIRDEPASLITLKLGINVVNGGTLRSRTFTPAVHGFLDTIRDGHPDTPIVVISPILCPTHENAPGPTIFDSNGIAQASDLPRKPNDGQLTLSDIREALAAAVEARSVSDPNLFFLDGTLLFGSDDVTHLPDGLHPDPEGYRLMGERFEAIARTASWLPTSVKASEY